MSDLNDPRVLFAAERTLLAWNRSCVALITLGFVIERFGLFVGEIRGLALGGQRELSFLIGVGLIAAAVLLAVVSVQQYRRVIKTLTPAERLPGYWIWWGALANSLLAVLGLLLIGYLVRGFG
jgi:putative membrane protein